MLWGVGWVKLGWVRFVWFKCRGFVGIDEGKGLGRRKQALEGWLGGQTDKVGRLSVRQTI